MSLPPPPTPEDVAEIARLYAESRAYMESAKAKLQTPPLPITVDWELSLYTFFCAWIVNFGLAPDTPEDPEEAPKSKQDAVVEYPKQRQHLIEEAAAAIGLEWIPFVDLALAPFSDHENPASGPFGGVFVPSRGTKPFMILAFKGTTFSMELNTNGLSSAVQVRAAENVLYSEKAHKGMGQGMFETFTYVGETQDAFEIVWDRLHTEARKLQIASGDESTKIPLYVTGVSLGAGYVTLAYIELIRRVELTEPTSFTLYDAWAHASPRVILKEGATRVRGLLQDPVRHFYRSARYRDIVPTLPPGLLYAYRHLDIGYKLDPENQEGHFVTVRPSEIDHGKENDPDSSWDYHVPERYYEGIKKVLDTQ